MKTLHLLRHAKSSWKEPGLDDHERPLSKRGRAAASAIAKHMKRTAIAPDIVICSTAVRTKETLEPIAKKLKPAKVIFEVGIYEVAESELWKHVGALPEQADTVLMIGHIRVCTIWPWLSPMLIRSATCRRLKASFRAGRSPHSRSRDDGGNCARAARILSRSFDRGSFRLPSTSENLALLSRDALE